ncbi:MAG: tetratricopeptide repeat protein [Verrucomicrobiaceae bacterium]|nr:MAG: tetratricopeptide repeat protein [Verrucomicrobiaceae bacterium]
MSELDTQSIRALARALKRAKGFSLFLVRCDSSTVRDKAIADLRVEVPHLAIRTIRVPIGTRSLLEILKKEVNPKDREVVNVIGIEDWLSKESNPSRSSIIKNLNASRNYFPDVLKGPLVIWVPDFLLAALIEGAPDFFSVRSGLYGFDASGPSTEMSVLAGLIGQSQASGKLHTEERFAKQEAIEKMLDSERKLPSESRDVFRESRLLRMLGDAQAENGLFVEAQNSYQKCLDLLGSNGAASAKEIAYSKEALATALSRQGKYQEATPLFEEVLAAKEDLGLVDTESYASTLNNVGAMLLSAGNYEGALEYLQASIQVREKLALLDDSEHATALSNLSAAYSQLGAFDKSVDAAERALRLRIRLSGEQSDEVRVSLINYAIVLSQLGDQAGALTVLNDALQLTTQLKGPDHPDMVTVLNNLSIVLLRQGLFEEAIQRLTLARELGNRNPNINPSPRAGIEENLQLAFARRQQAAEEMAQKI